MRGKNLLELRRGGRARRLLAAGAAVGLLATGAACGGGSSSTASGDKIINVFSGSNTGFIANFNPFLQTAVPGTESMIYEALLYFNQGKADDIQPQLATKYEFADGGKTLNFTLRDGIKWTDGQPFSSEDVAFTFNLLRTNEKINTGGLPITEATATDPTHVTLKFSEGVYTRLSNIAGRQWIVPKHLWSSVADASTYTNDKPIGTGPFTLSSFSAQNYVLQRNPNYWESGKPKIKGVRFLQFNSNESATAALAAGQLDWSGIFIQDINKQYVDKDTTHNKWINESQLYLTNLVPNHAKAPLNDLAVRQAISLALDRDQILKLAFPYGKPANVAGLPLPSFSDYVQPKYQSQKLEFNAQTAQQTLEQDGWAKGSDGIYAKGGKKLSVTCLVVTGYSDYISALQVIQQELKAAGIDFKTKEVSYANFATAQEVGDFEMIITNNYSEGSAYSWYNRAYGGKQTAPLGKIAASNYSRFSNPDIDQALLTIANTPPDQKDAIKAQIQKIQDIVVAQLPYIPLQQSSAQIEYRTVNATGWPTEDNHYALATPFLGPDMGIVAKNLTPVG
jgi:peptide/nickel transport system substrate-binding protein